MLAYLIKGKYCQFIGQTEVKKYYLFGEMMVKERFRVLNEGNTIINIRPCSENPLKIPEHMRNPTEVYQVKDKWYMLLHKIHPDADTSIYHYGEANEYDNRLHLIAKRSKRFLLYSTLERSGGMLNDDSYTVENYTEDGLQLQDVTTELLNITKSTIEPWYRMKILGLRDRGE